MTRMGRRALGAGLGVMLVALGVGCMKQQAKPQHGSEQEGFGSLSVAEVAAMVEAKSASIYDNNSQETYAAGHVPGAQWVAFNDVQAKDLPADKERPLVFYCANAH